jgi:hypothetical protein
MFGWLDCWAMSKQQYEEHTVRQVVHFTTVGSKRENRGSGIAVHFGHMTPVIYPSPN